MLRNISLISLLLQTFNSNKMSLVAYSSCAIQFIPNDTYARIRDYSDRSVIELHQDSLGDYILRGTDVENNKDV